MCSPRTQATPTFSTLHAELETLKMWEWPEYEAMNVHLCVYHCIIVHVQASMHDSVYSERPKPSLRVTGSLVGIERIYITTPIESTSEREREREMI